MDCCTKPVGHEHTTGNPTLHAEPSVPAAGGVANTKFLLPALIIVALALVFQTFQLVALQRVIQPAAAAPAVTSATTGGSAPLPSSLQNLPNMVGGC